MSDNRHETPSPATSPRQPTAERPVVDLKRTWDARATMREAEVPLAEIDSSIRFEGDYPEPIRYDASRRVLRYRGTMSHASFVQLRGLSDDRRYQLAVERLFVATAVPAAPRRSIAPWIGAAAAAVLLAAGGWGIKTLWTRPTAADAPEHVATLRPASGSEPISGPAVRPIEHAEREPQDVPAK